MQASAATVEKKKKAAGRQPGGKAATKSSATKVRRSKRGKAEEEVKQIEAMEEHMGDEKETEVKKKDAPVGRRIYDSDDDSLSDGGAVVASSKKLVSLFPSDEETDSSDEETDAKREKHGFRAMVTKPDLSKTTVPTRHLKTDLATSKVQSTPPRSSKLQRKREASISVEPHRMSKLVKFSDLPSSAAAQSSPAPSIHSNLSKLARAAPSGGISVIDTEKLQRQLRAAEERNQDYEEALANLRDINTGLQKRVATQSALLLDESKLTSELVSLLKNVIRNAESLSEIISHLQTNYVGISDNDSVTRAHDSAWNSFEKACNSFTDIRGIGVLPQKATSTTASAPAKKKAGRPQRKGVASASHGKNLRSMNVNDDEGEKGGQGEVVKQSNADEKDNDEAGDLNAKMQKSEFPQVTRSKTASRIYNSEDEEDLVAAKSTQTLGGKKRTFFGKAKYPRPTEAAALESVFARIPPNSPNREIELKRPSSSLLKRKPASSLSSRASSRPTKLARRTPEVEETVKIPRSKLRKVTPPATSEVAEFEGDSCRAARGEEKGGRPTPRRKGAYPPPRPTVKERFS